MLSPNLLALIDDYNALYYGYPVARLMERAGLGIARELINKYGKNKRITFVCGKGNNGGDGFTAARHLKGQARTEILLVSKSSEIRTSEARRAWDQWHGYKKENCSASDIPLDTDILVECLFGTGIKGKLKEPYASIIKKMNRSKGPKVSIDAPPPGYQPDLVISMMYPKVPGAIVVDIGYPKNLAQKIGIGEVKVLQLPKPASHKGDNGRLLIIGGSEQYHGAPLYSIRIASKIVDLIYFSSVPQNNALVEKMKSKSCEFITIPRQQVIQSAKKVDAVLIGPGMGANLEAKNLINNLLENNQDKKIILDADALKLADPKLLNPNCIVTPHTNEFKSLFDVKATKENVVKMARKHNCIVLLKGKKDYVSDGLELKVNATGNAGMTKGGTGDVLAGLTAALACSNDPFLAARTAVFLNGLAGDQLKERVSYYFNAADLIKQIPKTLKWCLDY